MTPATSNRVTRAQARALGLDVAATPAAAATPATERRGRGGATGKKGAPVPLAEEVAAALRATQPVATKLFGADAAAPSPAKRAFGTPLTNAKATTPARATPPPAAKVASATPQAAKAVTPAPAAPPATPVASPAGKQTAAVGSKSLAASTPFVGAASVSAILSEPEEPLSPEALPAPVAAPASPAPVAAASTPAPLGALSPLPSTARHALPFVPRASPASKDPAALEAESLGALRRAYKNALIEQRGRWPAAPEAPGSPAALPPPHDAPHVRLQPSVVVAPPPAAPVSYARALATNKAPKAGPKPTHDLAGIPVGMGRHTRFEEERPAGSPAPLRGVPASTGRLTRFE